jgi:biopolymer transport protein TolR
VKSSGEVFIGQEEATAMKLDEIGSKLTAIAGNRGGFEEPIYVRGDKAANYGDIARVMGRIRDAGFRKISLVTEVEGGG